MIDFRKLGDRKVVTPKLTVTLEISLIDSQLTVEEVERRLHMMTEGHKSRGFSEFVVDLIRDTRSNLWDLQRLEVKEGK